MTDAQRNNSANSQPVVTLPRREKNALQPEDGSRRVAATAFASAKVDFQANGLCGVVKASLGGTLEGCSAAALGLFRGPQLQ